MKKVPIRNLKEGIIFTEPVFIEGDNLLVPAGVEVRKKDINRLVSWGVEYVETEGELIHPAIKTPIVVKPDSLASSAPYRGYLNMIEKMNQVCNNITAGISIEVIFINEISGQLLRSVREQRSAFISFILGGDIKGRDMAKSMVNTAILASLTAIELKLPNHRVLHTVTGALLHDMGMLRLPKNIVDKRGGLSPIELQRVQSHTLHSFKIASKEMHFPADVGAIVLQHHERWDGEGYPRGISGEEIDIGARIVSVADAFEAMISQKPYRNPMIGYQAMKNLMADNLRRFDPNVIKAFITTMGIYPIGSMVLLNNGAYAKVIEVKSSSPLRPKVRVVLDSSGNVPAKEDSNIIDLLIDKNYFISKAVDPKEINPKYERDSQV